MVTVAQGDIWWADLPEPAGSAPGFRRPVTERMGKLPKRSLELVFAGIEVVFGR